MTTIASLCRGAGWGVSRITPGATRAMPSSSTEPTKRRTTAVTQAAFGTAARTPPTSRGAGRDRVLDPTRVVVADLFMRPRGIVAGFCRSRAGARLASLAARASQTEGVCACSGLERQSEHAAQVSQGGAAHGGEDFEGFWCVQIVGERGGEGFALEATGGVWRARGFAQDVRVACRGLQLGGRPLPDLPVVVAQ